MLGYYLSHCEPYFSARAGWVSRKIYEPSRKCLSERLPGLLLMKLEFTYLGSIVSISEGSDMHRQELCNNSARATKKNKTELARTHVNKKWWWDCQASTAVDTATLQRKTQPRNTAEWRGRQTSDTVQLEDCGASTRQNWMSWVEWSVVVLCWEWRSISPVS